MARVLGTRTLDDGGKTLAEGCPTGQWSSRGTSFSFLWLWLWLVVVVVSSLLLSSSICIRCVHWDLISVLLSFPLSFPLARDRIAPGQVAKGRSLPEGSMKKEVEEERSLQSLGMGGTVDVLSSMVKAADLEVLYGDMAMVPRQGGERR